jgi:TonB family protein
MWLRRPTPPSRQLLRQAFIVHTEGPGRQISSAKVQGAPLALASAPNPIAAPTFKIAVRQQPPARAQRTPTFHWPGSRLLSHLDHYMRYPDAARAQGHEGTALLSFGMNRDGHVLTYYPVRSSGCPALDDEVLAMIERASPLPAAPPGFNEQVVQLVVLGREGQTHAQPRGDSRTSR